MVRSLSIILLEMRNRRGVLSIRMLNFYLCVRKIIFRVMWGMSWRKERQRIVRNRWKVIFWFYINLRQCSYCGEKVNLGDIQEEWGGYDV